ncbi:MAG: hypothetical protein IKU38_02115 [Clostridia bacterium]|nr:hypothetical protein [Clostridia bacterium]
MKNKSNLSKKARQKRREKIFFVVLFGALILVAVLAVYELVTPEPAQEGMQYLVTGDGHVHTMDGQHISTVDEFFGEGSMDNLVVTEDGHVHTADGQHVGSIAEAAEAPAEDAAEK